MPSCFRERHTLRALFCALLSVTVTAGVILIPVEAASANPANTVAPALSAPLAVVGTAITTGNGTWTSNGTQTFAYQWVSCAPDGVTTCVDIGGATANTYTPVTANADKTLKARVTATDLDGPTAQLSNVVDVVAAPANTAAPVVSGTPTAGQVLTTTNGTFTGSNTGAHPMTFHYVWQSCNSGGASCGAIGTDQNTYTLTSGEVGRTVKVLVTAINDGGNASGTSALTATIAPSPFAPANTVAPSITGVARNGSLLTAVDGTWTGSPAPTFTYQWRRCDGAGATCTNIGGATANTYTAAAVDIASTLRVVVTGTNSTTSTPATSAQTAAVATSPPVNTVLPVISAVGNVLSTTDGTWTGVPTITFGYQWRRCDAAGATCSNIAGATANSYTTTSADVGSTIRVVVTGTNGDGNSSATSAQTAVRPSTVPDQPTITSANRGDSQITVGFTAPAANGGAAISGYTAACTSSNGGTFGQHAQGASPIVVTGLSNGKTYTCTVSATNSVGTGAPSSASGAVVPATVPGAPAIGTVTPHNVSIAVAFTAIVAPNDGGDAVTGYTATCTSSNGGATGTQAGSTSPITVASLTNAKLYTCTVHATNTVGSSLESSVSAATTPATVPDAPTIGTATRGDTQISVAFTAPVFNGGNAITGYTAACTSSNGGAPGNNSGSASPIIVSSLTNADSYTCTVHATNGFGNSIESSASGVVVPATVPAAPTVNSVTRGNLSVAVAYTDNGSGGTSITGNTATCTSSTGGTTRTGTSTSPITVSGLSVNQTYTCTVHATNTAGDSLESVPSTPFAAASPPDAPAQPTVTRGAAVIHVAFTAPNSNSSAITGYLATCSSNDGGAASPVTNTGSAVATSIDVSGVTNADTYTCTVHATNAFGNSTESVASAGVVPATVPTQPAQPTTTVTPSGSRTIRVTFVAPFNGGAAVTNYHAICTSSDGGVSGTGDGATSPVDVLALSKGNTYGCTITATNPMGSSLASTASTSLLIPATVADAPAAPTVLRGNALVTVTWVAPYNGGSAITGFGVNCVSSGSGNPGSVVALPGATSINVTLLTNGQPYTCAVLATNALGDSASSAASALVTPATTPSAPTIGVASRLSGSVSVAFTNNATGGDPITGATATCTSSNGGTTRSASGATPILVSTLTNGSTYTCTVVATNTVGNSAPSTPSNTFVAASVPTAPTAVVATRGNTTLSVAFVAAAANGDPITGFTASCTSSNGGAAGTTSGTVSPVVVTGLTNASSYTCTVHATNGMGSSVESGASAAVSPDVVPGAPTITSATRGSLSVSVAFTDGVDNGSAVIAHTATCTSSDGGTTRSASSATPIVVPALTDGKTYTCTVHSTNLAGSSSESSPSSSFIAVAIPDPPVILTATRGDEAISVAFAAGIDNGSVVTSFTSVCTSSDGGAAGINSAASSPIVVSSLTNGSAYSCTVHATNSVGSSAESAVSAMSVPATTPTTPTRPTVVNGNARMTVSFVAPANGGSAITGYTANCVSSNGGASASASRASSPVVVMTLTNAKRYTCSVLATNATGSSDASVASLPSMAGMKPHALVAPWISGLHPNRALTANNGSWSDAPTSTFTRQWMRCNVAVTTCVKIDGAVGKTYAIRGADLGHRIRLVVTAKNALGATIARSKATPRINHPVG